MLSRMRSQPRWSSYDLPCNSPKSTSQVSCCSARTFDSFNESRGEFEARQEQFHRTARGFQPHRSRSRTKCSSQDMSTNSYKTFDSFDNSHDETRAEFVARQEQIHRPAQGSQPHRSRSRPALRSSPDMSMNSYKSSLPESCQEDIVARFQGATITNAQGSMHLQLVPVVVGPSAAYAPVPPPFCNPVSTCAHMSASSHIGLQASMRTDLEASVPTAPSSKSRDRPGQLKRASIGGRGVGAAEGPSQRRQPRGATVTSAEEVEEVSEEVWQKRLGKKKDYIAGVKSLPMYYESMKILEKDIFRWHSRPQTPDPTRREPKRWFEASAAKWRNDLAAINGIDFLVESVSSKWKDLTNDQDRELRQVLFEDSKVAWQKVTHDQDQEKPNTCGKKHNQAQPSEAQKHALRKEHALEILHSQYFP